MKVSASARRGSLSITLHIGPVVWRCTNGRANHAKEWTFTVYVQKSCGSQIYLLPALSLWPWHKSALATIPDLGIESKSASLRVEFLASEIVLSALRSTSTPTPRNQSTR